MDEVQVPPSSEVTLPTSEDVEIVDAKSLPNPEDKSKAPEAGAPVVPESAKVCNIFLLLLSFCSFTRVTLAF